MKIIFFCSVIPPDYGGGFLRVTKTASRLKMHGNLDKILTYTKKEKFEKFENIEKNDIIFLPSRIISQFYIFLTLLRRRKQYDAIYIASANWNTSIAAIVGKMISKKVVIGITLSKSDSPAHPHKHWSLYPYYYYKNLQFKLADKLYVLSPQTFDECVNVGYKKEKVILINNPVNTQIYHPVSNNEKIQIRKSFCKEYDLLTFLFIGGVCNRKGFDIFPHLFESYFQETGKRINFVICGKMDYEESANLISQLHNIFIKYNSNLLIQGCVKDSHLYYKMTDFFLFPTRNEGMPNVILEAMGCGCNIVCNTLPGITDYVLPIDNLVKQNNIQEYLRKIEILNSDKNLSARICKMNSDKILQDYCIDIVDKKFIENII